jgi:hypothetical protein
MGIVSEQPSFSRIVIHDMNDTNLSREHFRRRFEQIINSYPHTISLFKKSELVEIFKELFSSWVTLSQTYKEDFVKIKIGDILLKRARASVFKRKPCHKLYHPIFGTVFELKTYKDEPPFLLTKCEKYLGIIGKAFGKGFRGIGTFKKELKSGNQFMLGSFFELEADVLLLSILNKPYSLKEKVVKSRNESDVDFIGNWEGKSLKFEIKSLCRSPKVRKESIFLDGCELCYESFKQDRQDRIKDILVEASKKFRKGDYNFLVIPDADRATEPIDSFESAVRGLNSGNAEISQKIISVITYRTDFVLKKPLNKYAKMIKVGLCPPWIDGFLEAFRGTVI